MAIKSNYVLQKTFTNFYKPQFQTGPTKNDLLTLNYGLPSSFTTLSTWRTTKRG